MALFFLSKYFGPRWVEFLYANGSISTLSQWLRLPAQRPLEYYLGLTEKLLFGPLNVLLSGLAFLVLSLRYLPRASSRMFALAVFLYLFITKFEVLFFPPYGDAIGGPFAEGIWLARHSFDYIGLLQQPGYVVGGPRVYMFSVYPSYLAALMKVIPHAKTFLVVNHLIVFMCSAIVISCFRSILLKVFKENTALLGSILFLALPLFQSQTETINMEIPVLLFSLLSAYYLLKKDIRLASISAILAAMVKGVAVYFCLIVFGVSLYLFFRDQEHKFRKATLLWGLCALLFVVLKYLAVYLFFSEGGKIVMVGLFKGWPSIRIFVITYLYALSILLFAGLLIKEKVSDRSASLCERFYIPIIMFLCAGGWFALFLQSYSVSPRYQLLAYPFVVFCALFGVFSLIKKEKVVKWSLIVGVAVSFICSYGLLHSPVNYSYHVLLERSLEYRIDLTMYRKVAETIEDQFSQWTVAAPFLYAQILALPELGYVTKKLDVTIYGMPCTYGGIKNFKGIQYLNLRRTIWIGKESELPDYPIGPQDKVIKEIIFGDMRARLFLGGVAIEKWRLKIKAMSEKGLIKNIYDFY